MEPVLEGKTCIVCNKKEVTSYCGKCKLTFYCNKDCRRKDDMHDLYCCVEPKIVPTFGEGILTPSNSGLDIKLLSHYLNPDKSKSYMDKNEDIKREIVGDPSTREGKSLNTLLDSLMDVLSTNNRSTLFRQPRENIYEEDRPNLEDMKNKKIARLLRLNKLKERIIPLLNRITSGSREAIIEAHEIKKELMLLTIENDCDMLVMEDLSTRINECMDIKMNLEIIVTQTDVTEPPSVSQFAKELARVCLN